MNAQTLMTLSKLFFAGAGLGLVLASAAFICFRIPVVISDLSGRTAAREMARLREENERKKQLIIDPVPVMQSAETTAMIPQSPRESMAAEMTVDIARPAGSLTEEMAMPGEDDAGAAELILIDSVTEAVSFRSIEELAAATLQGGL